MRSALGKAILAASPPALRREMLDLTASLVEEDAGLAKDRTSYSGGWPRSRQRQSDLLLVVNDAGGRRPKVSAQHEDGREGNRASMVRSEQGAGKDRLIGNHGRPRRVGELFRP